METRVRLLLVLAGLPEPTVNVIVRGEDGSWKMRFDSLLPQSETHRGVRRTPARGQPATVGT